MRIHMELDDELVREVDRVAGERGRTAFVRAAIQMALDQRARVESLRCAMGSLAGVSHDWEADPAGWVHEQRFGDSARTG